MTITLQKRIGYFWLVLSVINFVNYVYQTIQMQGAFMNLGNNPLKVPYFKQVYPSYLVELIFPVSNQNLYILYKIENYSGLALTLFSLLIPLFLIFNLKYSQRIAQVFLIVFILLSVFAIFIKATLLLPEENKFSQYEIDINKYVMKCIYYYSAMSFIAISMLVGLFFCKQKEKI
jgi:hypothetical protein